MKNINFVFKSQMDVFIYNNWKTDFFKKLQKTEGSVIDLLVKRLKEKNFYTFEYSNELEHKHMFLWFYHIGKRHYDNPYIHDLYFFHEFYHLISFPEKEFDNFDEWKNAMWQNELEASLMSEVYIYHFEPELRQYTFSQRIWCDDMFDMFGKEHVSVTEDILMFREIPERFKKIMTRRQDLRNGLKSNLDTENWIRSFNTKDEWFEAWRKDFKEVEKIRHTFEQDVKKNDYYASSRMSEALIKNSKEGTPFYDAAIKNLNLWT